VKALPFAVLAVAGALLAGAAHARTIDCRTAGPYYCLPGPGGVVKIVCTARDDRVVATDGRDRILCGAGNDVIDARAGADVVFAGSGRDRVTLGRGRDRVSGGGGRDTIRARDRARDVIACGPGVDTVIADRIDVVRRDCERVRRR
jgi:Ca2+-binding RTX toxin-like protein